MHKHTSLDYHIFNLLGLFNLAKVRENIDIDLWNYRPPEGSGLQKGLDYLLPYALGKIPLPHEQIKSIDKTTLFNLLFQATVHYEDNEYKEALHSIDQLNETIEINGLIYGCTCQILIDSIFGVGSAGNKSLSEFWISKLFRF